MNAEKKHIDGFGTIEVRSVRQIKAQFYEVIYEINSGDPGALDSVAKGARTLNACRFDCINRNAKTIELRVVSQATETLHNLSHPFNKALLEAIKNQTQRTRRSGVSHAWF